jgi:TetR/AcrR family transcriptional regulator, cholesterol catabolism regulator
MSTFARTAVATRRPRALGRHAAGARQRFDRRLGEILEHATAVFCDKGYQAASMRDLSRATGMSLAGLYYYFESKEKLLYLIQKDAFETILAGLRKRLESASDPEQRVRIFVQNHLEYFLGNQKAMKVLSHEDEALKNSYGSEIRAIKREYYRICLRLVEDLMRARGVDYHPSKPKTGLPGPPESSGRIAVLSLFGMMNWIYTWHNSRVDADAGILARQMSDIFLNGVLCSSPKKARTRPK